MTVYHEDADELLATNIDVADSVVRKGLGLMFRRSIPDDYALIFPFDEVKPRNIHTVFVGTSIDVCWVANGEVQAVETMPPMRGVESYPADTVVEAPAGTFDNVSPGDTIAVEYPEHTAYSSPDDALPSY